VLLDIGDTLRRDPYLPRLLDVLRCLRCSGRRQLIATIDDPAVIQGILAHLGLPVTRDGPQRPCSMTEAEAEQQALPGVTF
jgi:hypothetical protein